MLILKNNKKMDNCLHYRQYSSITVRGPSKPKEYANRRNLIGCRDKPIKLAQYNAACSRLTPRKLIHEVFLYFLPNFFKKPNIDRIIHKSYRQNQKEIQYDFNSARSSIDNSAAKIFIKRPNNNKTLITTNPNTTPARKITNRKGNLINRNNDNSVKTSPVKKKYISNGNTPMKNANKMSTPSRRCGLKWNKKPIILSGLITRKPSIVPEINTQKNAYNANCIALKQNYISCHPGKSQHSETLTARRDRKKSLIKLRQLVQDVSSETKKNTLPESSRSLSNQKEANSGFESERILTKLKSLARNHQIRSTKACPKNRNASLELPDDSNFAKIVSFVEEIKSTMDLHSQQKTLNHTSINTSREKMHEIRSESKIKKPLSYRSFAEDIISPNLCKKKILASRIKRHRQASINFVAWSENATNISITKHDFKHLNRICSSPHKLTPISNNKVIKKSHEHSGSVPMKPHPPPQKHAQHHVFPKSKPEAPANSPLKKVNTIPNDKSSPSVLFENIKIRLPSRKFPTRLKIPEKTINRIEVGLNESKNEQESGYIEKNMVKEEKSEMDFKKIKKNLHIQEGETVKLCPQLTIPVFFENVKIAVHDIIITVPEIIAL